MPSNSTNARSSASRSASEILCFTTSPIEIIPTIPPSSTTGMWRKRPAVMRSINAATLSASPHVTTSRVMKSRAFRERAESPRTDRARTISRSEMIPHSPPLSSTITIAPTLCPASRRTMSIRPASAPAVATARPLMLRMAATFIACSGVHLQSASSSGGTGSREDFHHVRRNPVPSPAGGTRPFHRSTIWK